ncbi:hypothetical protein CHH28_08235 [Bacterioplanes sanyensis]|uniref:DUF2878 domain-containing protein n=1 Tax=Bacterioplanes sanyensis TaxID=1249553 RepID=A0A222FHY0_9GAMM|nr:DUF2878 domain-containing protein [Bacterioplanes sanyensis]ASP38667.1 hypothetical protein CHH28_08235 [Bacterioplanes sanyensis]
MSPRLKMVGNIVVFQLCWLACVLGGNLWALLALVGLLAWHYWLLKPGEWQLLALFSAIGIGVDTIFMHLGWLQFDGDGLLVPVWLMVLWLAFASTLRHSLAWLMQRTHWAVLLGFLGAPWSYFAGMKLGAVDITLTGFVALALFWALLMLAASWQEKKQCASLVG